MRFTACRSLAEHFDELISAVGAISFSLAQDGELCPPSPNPATQPSEFKAHGAQHLQKTLQALDLQYQCPSPLELREGEALLFPTLQFAPLGINRDAAVTETLLKECRRGWGLCLTSGYFNFTHEYAAAILQPDGARTEILVASPAANSFFGASGAAGLITRAYSLLEEQFYRSIHMCGQEARVALREYHRPGWTYHAKGLWAHQDDDVRPLLTIVGSPNFGQRSVSRDLEASVLLITQDDKLRSRLANERNFIQEQTYPVDGQTFKDAGRFGDAKHDAESARTGWLIRVATRICQSFL